MKLNKNLAREKNEYTRYLGSFRGVDFSSDPTEVADYRLCEAINVYKDYRSGQGQAIETIPGFRQVGSSKLEDKIYGIHVYENAGTKKVYIHSGKSLYTTDNLTFEKETEFRKVYDGKMKASKSTSFIFNNRIYILDGQNYIYIGKDGVVHKVIDEAYIPTTHISLNPDGSRYEGAENSGEYGQQNILSDKYKVTYVADGKSKVFSLPLGTDAEARAVSESFGSVDKITINGLERYEAVFPEDFTVEQYGIKLPWANIYQAEPYHIERDSDGNPIKAHRYPNAIVSISAEGVISLSSDVPRAEENKVGRKDGVPTTAPNETPLLYAYPVGSAGVEIISPKKVDTIKGITSSNPDVGSIITGCTISTVYDGRVILSGNPDYPNIVFYCGRNVDTGYIDPSYFGILDWFSEGVTNTPITALVPVADTLMVLRSDTAQDGSVSFRTPTETGENVKPLVYKGTSGLSGVGCYGASCNFLDDPIFISKYGVEAIGRYTSAKYERGIEHRSHLIDGKLLNLDLSKATITEFDGYMWVLIEGKIFLADSRQTYTHQSGVMQYEWFYLDNIGIYEGQEKAYEYVDPKLEEPVYFMLNGVRYKIASVTDLKEYEGAWKISRHESEGWNDSPTLPNYGDTPVFVKNNDSPALAFEDYRLENEETGGVQRFAVYVKEQEYYSGGTFDPAIEIKAVDHDKLLFGTETGYICCFNFDKRDPDDDYKIPTDNYTFNQRIILSGLATKMDNCGIPHLIKNTVKKSMVVKMRTFPTSAAKIKVRTNRLPMREVERIIGGRINALERSDFNFEDLTYETGEKNIFRVREKEKKWLEKQIYFVSNEFKRPFALHHIVYSYVIAGRYKD